MTTYHQALCDAMSLCAERGAVFMGQAVACEGTAMSSTLRHLSPAQLVELPVAEEMQLGMALGASLAGGLVVTCYPRINFLMLAVNQLVNHLDKLPLYSTYRPKVIIRTAIATNTPLDPGPQHLGDYTRALEMMFSTVIVRRLRRPSDVVPHYREALDRDGSTLLVEYLENYGK